MSIDDRSKFLSIERASELLQSGAIGVIPTETVYGLAADARNALACAKIFEAKKRPHFDPIIVHLYRAEDMQRYCLPTPKQQKYFDRLFEAFCPGPLTFVLPKGKTIPNIVTSGLPHVAIRFPRHALTQKLLQLCDLPLAAPSANMFGQLSPTRIEHLNAQLLESVDFVLDGGPCERGIESTILNLCSDVPQVLRPGVVTQEDIETALGIKIYGHEPQNTANKPSVPGQLKSHYAPKTPMRILTETTAGELSENSENTKRALLTFCPVETKTKNMLRYAAYEHLSHEGNLLQAAAALFDTLFRLDQQQLQGIDVLPLPNTSLGKAMMDRLNRAAAK